MGARTASRAEITHGLQSGQRVVTYGAYGLEDGVKVALPGAAKEPDEKADPAGKKGDEKPAAEMKKDEAKPAETKKGETKKGGSGGAGDAADLTGAHS